MENPFFKNIKNIIENKKYEKLKNRELNTNFDRRKERKGITFEKGEITAAIKIFETLDRNEHPLLFEYVEHETQLWDFSKTKNPEAVKAQFVLECVYNAPTFLHYCQAQESDLENTPKRSSNKKGESLLDQWRAQA
jgi:hypothetical protein